MRKGILLNIRLWIEGEDEPAHNFADSTMKAVREILAAGKSNYPELHITLRKIEEDTNTEDQEET